jgi:hypothetical protein
MRLTFRLSIVLSLFLLAGCGSNLSVSTIQLGRSLNADGSVGSHTTRFTPSETVYASVLTSGAGKGVIKVRWTYSGKVMGEPTKEVRGAAATEFHLQSAGGLPPGDYAVEAFLDGISAGTRDFRVDIKK